MQPYNIPFITIQHKHSRGIVRKDNVGEVPQSYGILKATRGVKCNRTATIMLHYVVRTVKLVWVRWSQIDTKAVRWNASRNDLIAYPYGGHPSLLISVRSLPLNTIRTVLPPYGPLMTRYGCLLVSYGQVRTVMFAASMAVWLLPYAVRCSFLTVRSQHYTVRSPICRPVMKELAKMCRMRTVKTLSNFNFQVCTNSVQ